ncbi:hypothetical protein FZC79_07620 [Rossellomorea vietnamensis]|uniref:Uncharacterized protein n=1 Tax=Rossellomorea vietnamensis TaxID=218284 RepID=A0A5D4KID3_9BACI|nr:hypothetical protein [Rossellomorea vietnamensis]TYR76013.1 hypothetical protein FZC79_07620 [Rossellomorea vietnamensis]
MRKVLVTFLLLLGFGFLVAPTTSAAPKDGIYIGGEVNKYYSIIEFINSKTKTEEMNKAGLANVVLFQDDMMASASSILSKGGFTKAQVPHEHGKLPGKYKKVNGDYIIPEPAFTSGLNGSTDTVFINEEQQVVFRVGIEGIAETVELVKVGENNKIEVLTDLTDDGNVSSGDDIKDDGVYSGVYDIIAGSEGTLGYKVVVDSELYSDSYEISALKHLTNEEITTASAQSGETEQKFTELSTSLSKEEAQAKTVEWLNSKEEVVSAGISEDGEGIWYELDSGVLGGTLINEDSSKGGRNAATLTESLNDAPIDYKENIANFAAMSTDSLSVGSKRAAIISSFASQGGGLQLPNASYDNVSNLFTATGFNADRLTDGESDIDLFKNLENYGVVVIDTHGGTFFAQGVGEYNSSQVIFLTGEKATPEKIQMYEADLKKGRLAVIADYFAITPSFISHYNESLPGTIVFNGSCQSTKNDTMSNAFLNDGAQTYFGYSDNVLVSYDNNVVSTLFNSLVANGMTTGESFDHVINTHGTSDGYGAYFQMKGNNNVVISVEGLVNGKFEEGNLNGWFGNGDVRLISKLGPLYSPEGKYMSIISTGLGSVGESDSYISQTFNIPAGMTTLSFDYNVISEEPDEFLDSVYDDKFQVVIDPSFGGFEPQTLVYESVNTSAWLLDFPIDIDFYGGDDTSYEIGWKHVEFDVSHLAGKGSVTLDFRVWDEGDSAYDTAALIDNISLN